MILMTKRGGREPRQARSRLDARPLLTPIQAGGLQAVFKVLANDTRLRILHSLVRSGELCVTDLAAALGMKPQAVSNQLQRRVDLGILQSRREGTHMCYKIVNGCVAPLLELALCLLEDERCLGKPQGIGC